MNGLKTDAILKKGGCGRLSKICSSGTSPMLILYIVSDGVVVIPLGLVGGAGAMSVFCTSGGEVMRSWG